MAKQTEGTTLMGTVLVTGASSGIGWELARIFAREGYRPVITARRQAELEQLAELIRTRHGVAAEVVVQDLAQPGAAARLHEELQRRGLTVDILVNNAGFGTHGMFAETDPTDIEQLMMVNVVALTSLTRLLVDGMVQRGSGRILNVASIAAFFPGPLTSIYNASKAYVVSLTEALANELEGTGVTATAFCPGPTLTGFDARAGLVRKKSLLFPVMQAADVAEAGFEAVMQGRTVIVPGVCNRLRMLPARLVPRSVLARMARRYHETASEGGPAPHEP